ncbi:CapA family protein [Alkalihalobacterium chitinilyticum]|uniref:CapA family protein n=1 Tax=Alkalihalobacterium chitinilyticum TaxID=2980103 RepID=A0ABT5VK45_9BACI|nr:CapA family protein [Alkalihalobacterium chitinilyticum]MDE5415822.1 CapA family protein [Alkalihalobacterium chitinilyticum]
MFNKILGKDESKKFTLAATGDVLLHNRLYNKAKRKLKAGYDFNPMLENVKPLFEQGDIKIVNQESIIAGEEIGLSSYPKFNSPVEIGYTLKEFGVDIVNLANNHVLDKGEKGILRTIDNLNEIGMPYVGAYNSQKDKDTLRIIEKNGLRVCFVSCTKRMAGVKIPDGKSYLVDSFENANVRKISKQIQNIKKENLADVIVLSIHYGKEYHLFPTNDQREISATLSDAGADVIIGHHPHVLQPPAYILNSRGVKTFTAYSLGNFFSGQKGLFRQIGAYLTVDIEKKDKNSVVEVTNPKMTLTFVDSTDKEDYKMHLLEDIVAQREYIKTHMGDFKSAEVYEEIKERLRTWIPDMEIS